MYDQDTFFELTKFAQAGLAALSVLLGLFFIYLANLIFKAMPRLGWSAGLALRLGIAVTLLWLFLWLSPQVYYLYYQAIFDDLPWQIVVMAPPSITETGQVLFFQGKNSLAEHSKAILGWAIIIGAISDAVCPNRKNPLK